MLAKDKKPDAKKQEAKERAQVIPPRAETPKLLKAALEMTEKSGLRGALSKLKDKTNKSNASLQVYLYCYCYTVVENHSLVNIALY